MTRKPYETPLLRVHGDIREITRQVKFVGNFDGIFFDIDGNGPTPPTPIGS